MTTTRPVALVTGACAGIGTHPRSHWWTRVSTWSAPAATPRAMRMVQAVLPHRRAQRRGRVVPAWAFDRQVRKLNQLAG